MSWSRFESTVPAKWVLAGEHSVLAGATAVALPHPELKLRLKFEPGGSDLQIEPAGAARVVRELIDAVEEDWQSNDRSFERPRGRLSLESTIPVGAGLGSSAALCVAITRWLAEPLRIQPARWPEFATKLEHRFHGRSSGMDVAVINAGEPISFGMAQGARTLGIRRLPRFTFHDTGLRARTSECVLRVGKFREETPTQAMQTDEKMATAARGAMEGLALYDRGERASGLVALARAMKLAQECFYVWALVPGDAKRLEDDLMAKGALACKLTGAGGGGMVVALWGDS